MNRVYPIAMVYQSHRVGGAANLRTVASRSAYSNGLPSQPSACASGDISLRANLGYVGGRWSIRAMTMPQFAKVGADYCIHAPILDRTGLSGSFDYTQKESDLDPAYSGPAVEARFMGLISELGLKLTRTKGPVETFIIDSAAKPNN